ncbi:MAG: hypothetical protein IPJ95_18045 [Gemmatimonadetes bacterium]|nr:hypothetical protein [Gemmatimonadota bacterium]
MRTRPTLLATLALALGCASSTDGGGGNASMLTILGSAGLSGPLQAISTPVGAPASMSISMYKLALSPNADCTGAVEVQDYGVNGQVKDFTQSPTLFQAQVDSGSYPCVAIKLSDVIGFRSDTDSLSCQTGVDYTIDVYRPGVERAVAGHQPGLDRGHRHRQHAEQRPAVDLLRDRHHRGVRGGVLARAGDPAGQPAHGAEHGDVRVGRDGRGGG